MASRYGPEQALSVYWSLITFTILTCSHNNALFFKDSIPHYTSLNLHFTLQTLHPSLHQLYTSLSTHFIPHAEHSTPHSQPILHQTLLGQYTALYNSHSTHYTTRTVSASYIPLLVTMQRTLEFVTLILLVKYQVYPIYLVYHLLHSLISIHSFSL